MAGIHDSGDKVSVNEMLELNTQRSAMYGLLARIFRVEVDEGFLNVLRGVDFPADTESESFDSGYRKMVSYLSTCQENALTELAIDYVKAFIGHGMDAYAAAYPYESVYTSPRRLLMQDARDKVLEVYRHAGLEKKESWKEGEDHISLELEYMQILSDRASNALESGCKEGFYHILKSQKSFLKDHLILWVPQFAQDVQKFAKTDFYKGAGLVLSGYLSNDFEFICDLLEGSEEAQSTQCA